MAKYRSILDIQPPEQWTQCGDEVMIPSCFGWDVIEEIQAFIDVRELVKRHDIDGCPDRQWNSLTNEYNCAHGAAHHYHLIPAHKLESVRHITTCHAG